MATKNTNVAPEETVAEGGADSATGGGNDTVAGGASDTVVGGASEDSETAGPKPIDNGIAPATSFETSGSPVQIVPDVDPSHPAVDNDPRAYTTADQNKIDFNDPTLSGAEAVKRSLDAQAKG